jgi:hypothetical protein
MVRVIHGQGMQSMTFPANKVDQSTTTYGTRTKQPGTKTVLSIFLWDRRNPMGHRCIILADTSLPC